jgi:glycosyltransferase involved in cell wall biosynthesis
MAAGRGNRKRPIIASIRGSDVTNLLEVPFMRSTILAGLRKATWITSVNQLYMARVAQDVPVAGRSSVIRNGIARPADQAMWQLRAENRGGVGTVGQFRKVKDIPLLIRAYHRVPAALRRRLLLAGYFAAADASEAEWSHCLIEEFGIAEEVRVTGRFDHAVVFDHLRSLHVYVQASAYEGLPNAVLEAASLGVPLVATAVGGLAEILEDGVSALLAPHGDPASLGAAIARVLADDALAQRLSQGAQAVAATLSVETERAQWLALYAKLLGEQIEIERG